MIDWRGRTRSPDGLRQLATYYHGVTDALRAVADGMESEPVPPVQPEPAGPRRIEDTGPLRCIVDLLRSESKPLTPKQVTDQLRSRGTAIDVQVVAAHLKRMCAKGWAEQRGQGFILLGADDVQGSI